MGEGDAISMLTNIGKAMCATIDVVKWPVYVAGIFCMFSALYTLASNREGAMGKGIMLIFIAGLFAALPTFVNDMGVTLFNLSGSDNLLSYDTPGEGATVKKAAIFAVFTIIRVVGIIAVYKGFNRLKFYNMSPNGDPRLVSEAMTLITMGSVAAFAKEFIIMIANTVGDPVKGNILELFM